jgi:hypothetical protein
MITTKNAKIAVPSRRELWLSPRKFNGFSAAVALPAVFKLLINLTVIGGFEGRKCDLIHVGAAGGV